MMKTDKRIHCVKRIFLAAMIFAGIAVFCTGCHKEDHKKKEIQIVKPMADSELFKIGDEICSVSEADILIAAQKKLIEEIYGSEIWSVKTEEGTFDTTMKKTMLDYLARLKTMKLMAEENGIVISAEDDRKLKQAADTYFQALTESEKEEMEIDREEIQDIFQAYYYYNRLLDYMTSNLNLEISDSEARVMELAVIFIAKNGEDRSAYASQVRAEAAAAEDFLSYAEKVNENGSIKRKISRNQMPGEIRDKIFSMNQGTVSDVLEASDGYYIIQCVNDYDREGTLQYKNEIIRQKKEDYFNQEYQSFMDSVTAQINQKVWDSISISELKVPSEADFFEIYNSAME